MESQTVQLAHFIVATVVDFAIIQLDLQTTVSDVDCPSSDDLRLVRIAFAAFAAQGAAGQQDSRRPIITNRRSTPHIVMAAVFRVPCAPAQSTGHNPGSPRTFPHHRKT
jgi:hypothetical protein